MAHEKHAIVVAHPNAGSFNLAVAKRYRDAVEAMGCETVFRDLYSMNFEPALQDGEIPRPTGFAPGRDVAAERSLIQDARVFAFIYPLWFNTPPAILVGYIQRVFGMGFGYGPQRSGANAPLLHGRSLIAFTSSGAPEEWVRSEGSLGALRNLFEDHLAAVCGMTVLDHRHYGGVLNTTPSARIETHMNDVSVTAQRCFGPQH